MSDAQQASETDQQSQGEPEGPVLLPPYVPPVTTDEAEAAPETAPEPETTDDADEDTEQSDQERDEKGRFRKPKPVQPRIDELTRKVGEAEREAAFWKAQAEAQQQQREQAETQQEPQEADFGDDFAGYLRALTRYEARATAVEIVREQRAQEAANTQAKARETAWNAATAVAKAQHSDYDAVMQTADSVQLAPHLQELLLSSDVGPSLSYQIALQPDIADRLNRLPPMIAAKEIARMEDKLAKPAVSETPAPNAPARTTNAPRPGTPISAQRTTAPNPQQMSTEEYVAWREAQNPTWKRFR